MLLTNRINSINSQIQSYLDQIAALQTQVTDLQAHVQEVQSVEQAAESALLQVEQAIAMLNIVSPDDIATFKQALDSKFNCVAQIAAGTDIVETVVQDEPPAPTPEEPQTVEAIATVVDDPAADEPQAATKDDANGVGHGNGNGNGTGELLRYSDLDKVDRATLQKLAGQHGIIYTAKTKKYELATALAGMVTQTEVDFFKNGKQ